MRQKPPSFHCLMHDQRWNNQGLIGKKSISKALEKTAEILDQDFSSQDCTIALSNDLEIQGLNKLFRHKDKPTNVLSFPSGETQHLGDIILAYETIEKEALEGGISLVHHTLHLIIHGFLHLLGYDHEKEKEALQMEDLEIRILQALHIVNPYEGRDEDLA